MATLRFDSSSSLTICGSSSRLGSGIQPVGLNTGVTESAVAPWPSTTGKVAVLLCTRASRGPPPASAQSVSNTS